MSTTSTLAAAQIALSDLLANRKPTSSKRRKASKKSATSATTVSAAKQTVDLEAAARRLANQGKIGNKEKDARERVSLSSIKLFLEDWGLMRWCVLDIGDARGEERTDKEEREEEEAGGAGGG